MLTSVEAYKAPSHPELPSNAVRPPYRAVLGLILFSCTGAFAQTETPKSESGATEAANVTTVGDFFKFNVDVGRFRPSEGEPEEEVTAPRGSCFRVSQELDREDPEDESKTQRIARGRFETGWFPHVLLPPYHCKDEKELAFNAALSYDVPKQMILEDRDRSRYGYTYGVLVAPFKFYAKQQEFSAAAFVGPYLGYRMHDRQGSSSVVALSIAVATASVKVNNPDGTTTDSSATGYSAAAAYILEIKKAFNLGLMAGADFFSKSQNIENSNKLWLGVSFGYKMD